MSPAQHSPGRPPQGSVHELATSNSTANRFLGTAQKPWMKNGAFPTHLPTRPPVAPSTPRVTTLPSRPTALPSRSSLTSATPSNAGLNKDPTNRRVAESAKKPPSDRAVVPNSGLAPVSPITPEAKLLEKITGIASDVLPPANTDQARQLPTLPSPEPSNDSHISPAAITEVDRTAGPSAVAPAASILAKSASVEGMPPTVPAVAQSNPSSMPHSPSSPAGVLSLPSESSLPYPSPRPASTPPDSQSIWRHARNRLKILLDKSNDQQSLSETVELPRVRILQDACVAQDMFYLALHQVYCIQSFAPSQLQTISKYGITTDAGLDVIKQLLVDNQRLSGDFLKWSVSYPSPLSSMLELEDYRSALQQVAYCLSTISKNWFSFEHGLRTRGYPPQVEELVGQLGVKSNVLQTIIFTALSRRLFGSREQLLKACIALFERDQASYKKRQAYSEYERLKEVSAFAENYQKLCITHGVLRRPSRSDFRTTSSPSSTTTTTTISESASSARATAPATATAGFTTMRPSPAPSPASTATATPHSNSNAPGPLPQQRQSPLPPHVFHAPPTDHRTLPSHTSPHPPRPVSTSGSFPNMPPNTVMWPVQQGRHPPQVPPLPIPQHVQYHSQSQAGPQPSPLSTSREGTRQGPGPIPSPDNGMSNPQMQSPRFQNHPHRRPVDIGPAMQAPIGRPASTASPVNFCPPNTRSGPASYAAPPYHSPYSPYPMGQNVHSPVAYGPQSMYPSYSTTPPGMNNMAPMVFPSQLVSKPPEQPSQQASPVPVSVQTASGAAPSTSIHNSTATPHKSNGAQQGLVSELTPNLVHYFSDFAILATRLPPNRSAFAWQFSVSREMLGKRPRLAPQEDGRGLVPYLSDGNISYRLRCIKFEGQLDIYSLASWSRAESSWPDVVYIHINNKELHRPHNSKNAPLDINRFLKEGVNEVRLNVLHNAQQRTRNISYAIAVEILKFKSTTSFMKIIKNLPSQESRQQIQKRLAVNNDDEDLMIMDNSISIDLRDPFTTRIFDTPVRGSACTHMECFDLSTFLQTITFTPASGAKRSPYLRCPICRKDARPHLLIIDNFLLEVRAVLGQEQKLETTKAIRVKPDGSWEAVLEIDNDTTTTPSRNLKRDRASFESDLPKTEEKRETSLSRIPEAPEVIELD